ncbi:MAG: gluconate:H+ symporter, partial [Balneolaceae bacterium]|nr:gluconate:H+ symporter [Balneolaceae bacterium]
MPLIIVATGIALLLTLIVAFRVNAFIAFVVVSIGVGVAGGMPLEEIIGSIQEGIGSTLGFLVMILGFGAMLGKLVAESGAAQRITTRLVGKFGTKNIQWAVVLSGFIVGIPMFYSVGFVILIPLVFTVAASTGLPLLYVGMPMLASLSVTHGYLPPHPAPTAIADMFNADIGKTMIYGIIIAIPAIVIAGPLFSRRIKNIEAKPIDEFVNPEILPEEELPGIWTSILTALSPVVLIGAATLFNTVLPVDSWAYTTMNFLGDPVLAMLLSVLIATWSLGLARGRSMQEVMESLAHSVKSITMVLLIIAGAGGLKQILVDSGV